MIIQNHSHQTYKPQFRAKFLHSESLKMIADYAVEHGRFDKLNQARKNIDLSCLPIRIRVDIGLSEKGFPLISFTKFRPKNGMITPKTMNDYELVKCVTYSSEKKENLLKFAMEKIIKMGNHVPNNKIFKTVVIRNK